MRVWSTLPLRHALAVAFLALCAPACEAPGVGDPCEPEQVPMGGFVDTEAYLETSSVQCRTRVCMVYKLDGDPRRGTDPGGSGRICEPNCASEEEVQQRVYCTCRCDGPAGSASFCECPEGYACEEILELGGPGIKGSYCVKKSTLTGT